LIHWSIYTIIPLVSIVLYAVLFGIVITSKPFTYQRRWFSVYLIAMFGWSISAFLVLSGIGNILFWFRMMTSWVIISLLGIFGFVQTVFSKRREWTIYVILYSITIALLTTFTDQVVGSAALIGNILEYSFHPLMILFVGPGYFLMLYSLVLLVRGTRQTDNLRQRERFHYLSLALIIITLGTALNFTPLGQYPIDIASNGLAAILIAYAILRYQLLEIRVVVRIGLFYSIATAIAGVLYFVIISQVLRLFESYTKTPIFIISALIALLTAIIFAPIYTKLQTWIDRVFYRERYNGALMLQRLSGTTATLLDLEKITDIIIDELSNTIHIEQIAFFIRRHNNEQYELFNQQGSILPLRMRLHADNPVVKWLSTHREILTKHDFETLPIFRSLWGKEREVLEAFKASLYIPLIAKDSLVGILAIGESRSGRPYSKDEQAMLTTLANQTAVAIENARLYEELEDTFMQTVISLANAIDIRDTYTRNHSQEIAKLAADTARELGLSEDEVDSVYWGGLLHDIGKIGIPDSILLKPGPLTDEERKKMQYHTIAGAQIISPIQKLSHVAPFVRSSHERYDGKGYPDGLKGEEIPLGARIIAVVDAYSAITDDRVYRKARSHEEAVKELERCSGTQFDTKVLQAFLRVIEKNPEKQQGIKH